MLLASSAHGEEEAPFFTAFIAILVLFLFSLGVGVLFFVFPLFAFRSNWSGGWLGLVFSGYFFARMVVSPFAGNFADRYGCRIILLFATICSGFLVCSYFALPSQYALFCIQFGLGLTSGIIKPVVLAYLAAVIPAPQRGTVFGWSSAATNLVFFLGPAAGGLLYYYFEIDRILIFVAGFMFVAFAAVYFWFSGKKSLPSVAVIDSNEKGPSKEESVVFSHIWLLIAIFGRTLGISILLVFFPILLSQRLAEPDWVTGLLVAVPGGTSCLLLPVFGRLANRSYRILLVLLGLLTSGFALFITGYCSSVAGFITTGFFMGAGTALSLPSAMLRATDGEAQAGRAMGIFQMAASAGFLAGPVLGGLLVQWTASAAIGIIIAGIIGLLLCLPLSFSALKEQKNPFSLLLNGALVLLILISVSLFVALYQKEHRQQDQLQQNETFATLAMGGIVHLKMSGVDQETASQAASDAFAVISRLEADFGHRNSTGSIGMVNRFAGKEPVEVSPEAFALVARALHFGELSDGVFDVTIGAVTVLPFYYREKASSYKADLVNYKKVEIDQGKRTVFLPEKGMALDLGGLAKGSIVDAAAAEIQKAGVPAALLEASGDFFCYGDKIWRVGIQDPRSQGLLGIIEVKNAGVCGSGDYYQYDHSSASEDKRQHHILDPSRLSSARKSIAVTVIAPSTELADALATTLFIMGPETGRIFLKNFNNCSALWVLPDRQLVKSSGFPPFLKE